MRSRRGLSSISATVAAFAALGLAAVGLVAIVASVAIRHITDEEALRESKQLTRMAALSAVEPEVSDRVVTGQPTALARLDRAVRTRVLRAPVVRVKIWTLDGRIVYSDARELIGRRFGLDDEQRRAAQRGVVEADISDAAEPENVFERGLGKLLEVYLPVRTPGGGSGSRCSRRSAARCSSSRSPSCRSPGGWVDGCSSASRSARRSSCGSSSPPIASAGGWPRRSTRAPCRRWQASPGG